MTTWTRTPPNGPGWWWLAWRESGKEKYVMGVVEIIWKDDFTSPSKCYIDIRGGYMFCLPPDRLWSSEPIMPPAENGVFTEQSKDWSERFL